MSQSKFESTEITSDKVDREYDQCIFDFILAFFSLVSLVWIPIDFTGEVRKAFLFFFRYSV